VRGNEKTSSPEKFNQKRPYAIQDTALNEMNKKYAQNMKNIMVKLQDSKIKSFIARVSKGQNSHLLIDDPEEASVGAMTNFRKNHQ
jgi:hypothetical protein